MADNPSSSGSSRPVDLRMLRQLIKLMNANSLTEIDLRDGDQRIRLRKGGGLAAGPADLANPLPLPLPATPPAPAPAAAPPAPPEELPVIKSPTPGTFYAASEPGAEPFVRVGSRVEPDTVVCIIEAMKVFNQITAEIAGTIVEVLVTDGQAVEFNQPLFRVRP